MGIAFKINLNLLLVNVVVINTYIWTCYGGFTNIALHKPAYQTDDFPYGGVASAAVDGDTDQTWTIHGTCAATNTDNASWEVDLGELYGIDHVIIYNRQNAESVRLQEVEIYVGHVREQYSLKAYSPGLAGSILVLPMNGLVYGRWVKITRRTPYEILTLCEVQVMIRDNLRFTNLALHKPAYQTDDYPYGGVASAAVDGDTDQTWTIHGTCTATNTDNVSWEVDLGELYVIDHVIIYNRQDAESDRLQEVEVYVGSERERYSLKAYQPGLAGLILVLPLDGVVYGRWVKITRRTPNSVLTLCEVQVMGRKHFMKFHVHDQRQVLGSPLRNLTADHQHHCCFVCSLTRDCDGAQYIKDSRNCTLINNSSSVASADVNHVYLDFLQ